MEVPNPRLGGLRMLACSLAASAVAVGQRISARLESSAESGIDLAGRKAFDFADGSPLS